MGAQAVRALHDQGYRVAVLSSSGKGETLALALGGLGVTGSNRSQADLQRLVDETVERWGRIDVLVNSAAHGPRAAVAELSDEDWHEGLEVYLLGVVRAVRSVLPVMLEQGSGSIVNISTFATFEPEAAFPTSGVFRAGLAAYAKLFADQYADRGLRMNNVLPGFVDSFPEQEAIRARIPMQRYGTTREIAEVIAFLASPAASYVTGQNLRVDGGLTRSV